MDSDICTICADCIEDDGQCTELECGHRFHVPCILQWFREGEGTCPNCRSEGVLRHLMRLRPGQRMAHLRRRAHSLPAPVRQRLKRLTTLRTKRVNLASEHRALYAKHKKLFAEERKLRHKVQRCRRDHDYLYHTLLRLTPRTTSYPFDVEQGVSEVNSDSDSGSDSEGVSVVSDDE